MLLQSSYFTFTFRRALRDIARKKIGNKLPEQQREEIIERWLTKGDEAGAKLVDQLGTTTAMLGWSVAVGALIFAGLALQRQS